MAEFWQIPSISLETPKMSPPIETLKPLTIDPESNAESIENLQQICFALSELIADLARAQYAHCRTLNDSHGMAKFQQIGEAAMDIAVTLSGDY